MNRCIVLGDKQSFVVLSEDVERLEEAMDWWLEEYENYLTSHTDTYVETYREVMGIPMDATLEEERDLIIERFGESPLDSEKFTELAKESERRFTENKPTLPSWKEWFDERGFETEDVTHIIDYRE